MPVPWSSFEPEREGAGGPAFLNKSAWAQAREVFSIIGIKGPVKGRFGKQWVLTVLRVPDNAEFSLGLPYGTDSRDEALVAASDILRKGEEVGPCMLHEIPNQDPAKAAFFAIRDADPTSVAEAATRTQHAVTPPRLSGADRPRGEPVGEEPPPLDDLPW